MADPTETANEKVVRDFCEAFARRDVDELMAFFTLDAVYHNIPMAPAEGSGAIREALARFLPMSPHIEFEMLNLAVSGSVVFTERVDRMSVGGRDVALPVAGVFEVQDGRIRAWRDYFDMQMFLGGS
jgi:limonene-1,2-epoxide hydrolase